jgi:hypothetical protein
MSNYSPQIKKPAICSIAGGWSMRRVISYPDSLHSARDVSSRQHRQQAQQHTQIEFERSANFVANRATCVFETIFVMAFIV